VVWLGCWCEADWNVCVAWGMVTDWKVESCLGPARQTGMSVLLGDGDRLEGGVYLGLGEQIFVAG